VSVNMRPCIQEAPWYTSSYMYRITLPWRFCCPEVITNVVMVGCVARLPWVTSPSYRNSFKSRDACLLKKFLAIVEFAFLGLFVCVIIIMDVTKSGLVRPKEDDRGPFGQIRLCCGWVVHRRLHGGLVDLLGRTEVGYLVGWVYFGLIDVIFNENCRS
jgi:hypothetical protein